MMALFPFKKKAVLDCVDLKRREGECTTEEIAPFVFTPSLKTRPLGVVFKGAKQRIRRRSSLYRPGGSFNCCKALCLTAKRMEKDYLPLFRFIFPLFNKEKRTCKHYTCQLDTRACFQKLKSNPPLVLIESHLTCLLSTYERISKD
jgi:hypothetical protein